MLRLPYSSSYFQLCILRGEGGWWDASYNGLCGEAPTERGTFFKYNNLQYHSDKPMSGAAGSLVDRDQQMNFCLFQIQNTDGRLLRAEVTSAKLIEIRFF